MGATVVPDDCALIMRTEAAGVSKQVLEMDITSLASDWEKVRDCAAAAVSAAGQQGRSPMPRRLLAGGFDFDGGVLETDDFFFQFTPSFDDL